jgi:UDP-N-acetylmuramate dehydrogenase
MMTATILVSGGPRGRLVSGEPMARHNSWRAGGAADRYFEPADIDDLAAFLPTLPAAEPILWIGLGSNLLVRDGGIRGTVINTTIGLGRCEWIGDGVLHAEAGVPCAKIAKLASKAQRGGAEFLAGIPGSMGGALAMNAGAFGGETWDLVTRVETIDRSGQRRWRGRAEFDIAYRQVRRPAGEWFIVAELAFKADRDRQGEARIRDLLGRRASTQPLGLPSCGSVFRNPPGDFAGRLIEACGLKGERIGGAAVAERHANFIVNDGKATAADIESLIERVREKVRAAHGVELVPEVCIVGEPA